MVTDRPHFHRRVIAALILLSALGLPAAGRGQEVQSPERIATRPVAEGPFAVRGAVRKELPPLDCLRCPGPVPLPPCETHHRGFLYFGTYPWDDDHVNGFQDCPRGQCGHLATGLSRAWLRLFGPGRSPAGKSSRHRGRGGECSAHGDSR